MSGSTSIDTNGAPLAGGEAPPAPDVEAIVAELRADVQRKRAAGAYPADLLERLRTEFHPDEGLEPPEVSVLIQSSRWLRSDRPVVGGTIVFGKRVIRRLLAWYVAPIAVDQTRFNLAILRELRDLEERVARFEGLAASTPDRPEKGPRPRARR
jgi:hypothetical protein